MTIEITEITPEDIPSAVTCIQLAFDDDPYNNWVFDKRPGKFNAARNFASLKAKCEWGMRHAMFFVAKERLHQPSTGSDQNGVDAGTENGTTKVLGVGMWMKPQPASKPQSWSEWWDEYLLWIKQGLNVVRYRGWGGLNTTRYYIWKREQAIAQTELWTDPQGYYFCNIVVVLPGHQGKGIGRKLFDVVTEMADREGRKCYLESSRAEPNTAIYEKLGFQVAKKMVCEEAGDKCDLYCMVRQPQAMAKSSSAEIATTQTVGPQLPHVVERIGMK